MRTLPLRALTGVTLAALVAAPLAAAARPMHATPDAVTHHTLVLDGRTLNYTTRAGTLTLFDGKGQASARVFYTADTLDGADPSHRAVTFFWNGGPGSSTLWLRMGSFGPVRVVTADGTMTGPPPYRIVNNRYSLLDKTDLVFIDMPGSGFGRILTSGPKDFWGVDKDIAAFGQFIQRYVSYNGRWNSPKFLFGESYGTTRAAGLSWWLAQHGVGLNGIVLQSSYLNADLDYEPGAPIGGGDWAYVFYLPTEAAVAWYHHVVPGYANLTDLLAQVKTFALTEYLDALGQGALLPAARFDDVVAKLHRFTGLSTQYIRNSNLRIRYDRFDSELLREHHLSVGRLDGRFVTYTLDAPEEAPDWDTTDAAIDSAFVAANNVYLRQTLHYDPTDLYRYEIYDLIYADGNSWDNKHDGIDITNVTSDLAQSMTYNPSLQIFSANGYYDFATPFFATEYALDHLNLRPAIQRNITYGFYQSGHMVYLHVPALAKFHADLERWYAKALKNR